MRAASLAVPARSLAVTVVVSCVYIVFEWLFFVTKPSLLAFESVPHRLQVLASAPLPLILAGVAIGAVPGALLGIARPGWLRTALRGWATLFPSFLLAGTALLLVENFTYTLFGYTVVSAPWPQRTLYGVAFAGTWARVLWSLQRWIRHGPSGRIGRLTPAIAGALSLVALAGAVAGRSAIEARTEPPRSPRSDLPDIYLIGTDGVVADHLSGFGYARPTTPYLDRWMQDAMVFENALTNGGETTAALGSLLTGRLPTRTHVIYRPDSFLGSAAYRHLPGILRASGYRSISLGVRYIADPFDLNMIGGFDRAIGGRTDERRAALGSRRLTPLIGENAALFVEESAVRLLVRVGHIFGVVRGANWIEEVRNRREGRIFTDEERMSQLFEFLEATPSPVFAHLHLMDTHGPRLTPRNRLFGGQETRRRAWNDGDYDDAIRDFDDRFGRLIEWLKVRDRYGRALVVVYSDHARRWRTKARIPLILRIPGDHPQGRRSENAQLADVAPTLLAHLQLPIPEWMDGASLLDGPLPADRPIFFTRRRGGEIDSEGTEQLDFEPPFFTLGHVGLVRCDFSYSLNVVSGRLERSRIVGHTRPCAVPPLENLEARVALFEHLRQAGFDISAIPDYQRVRRRAPRPAP